MTLPPLPAAGPADPAQGAHADETLMFAEAREAAEAAQRALDHNRDLMRALGRALRERAPRLVVTCARGSSDHAATFAKYLIETRAGVLTASAAPSVSSIYESRADQGGSLCLAISQSGRSPDLLATVEAAREAGAFVVALVNAEDSPLARLADVTVPLLAGPELSVAATKSYIASLFALVWMTAEWTEDQALLDALERAPERLRDAFDLDWTAAIRTLEPARNLYVLGRGLGFGVAQEAALKFKETCGLHAEAFSAAEVRHGPMALVERGFPVLVFVQDDATRSGVQDLIPELAATGAEVLLAGATHPGATSLPTLTDHPALEPLYAIQSFYRMAEQLSRARGLDPDHPPGLHKVTRTI